MAYGSQYEGLKEDKITCYFENSNLDQTCYSRKDQCTGKGECSVTVVGKAEERLTWQNTCSNEYEYTIFDGSDKEITFNCDSLVEETVTCVFNEADTEKTCTSQYNSCTGLGSCDVIVEAPEGERILWRSNCGGLDYSTQDWVDEDIEFECGSSVSEKVICNFEDKTQNQVCYSDYGSCQGQGRCLIDVTGDRGTRVRWTTTLGEKSSTLLDGRNEYANFKFTSVEEGTDSVTCIFTHEGGDLEQYTCTPSQGGDYCKEEMVNEVPEGFCTTTVSGELGTTIMWQSDMPNSINKITQISDESKEVEFSTNSEICDNGIDDDYDGKVDCEIPRIDPDCYGFEEGGNICTNQGFIEYICNDYIDDGGLINETDNDFNGDANCFDSNCWVNPPEHCWAKENGEFCEDNIDNDADGDTDEDDVDCRETYLTFDPQKGYYLDTFIVDGYNFVGETITLNIEWGYSQEVDLNENGDFSETITVPEGLELGPYEIWVEDYEELEITDFEVLGASAEPEFDIRPLTGIVGSTVNFDGTNFDKGVEYPILFDEEIVTRVTATDEGVIQGTFIVPESHLGDYDVYVEGYFDLKQIFFVVSGDPDPIIEIVTCQFEDWDDSNEINGYTCTGHTEESLNPEYSCTGTKTCSVNMEGYEVINYIWTSDVPDTTEKITTLDGETEPPIRFVSPTYIQASWVCNDGYSVSATNPEPMTQQKWLEDYIEPSCFNHLEIDSYVFVKTQEEENLIGQAFRSFFINPEITDNVTCVFDKPDNSIATCYSDKGRCEGVRECSFDATGEQDESFTVRSTVLNSIPVDLIIDGKEDIAIFSQGLEQVTDTVTCVFIQSEEIEQTCYVDDNRAKCSGTRSCVTTINGYFGEPITWYSTIENSNQIETLIQGNEKHLEFVEGISAEPEQKFIIPEEPSSSEEESSSVEPEEGFINPAEEFIPETEEGLIPSTEEEISSVELEEEISSIETEESQVEQGEGIIPLISKTITCSFGNQISVPGTVPLDGKSTEPLFSCSYTINEGISPEIIGEEGFDQQSTIPPDEAFFCSAQEEDSCDGVLILEQGTILNFESDYGDSSNSIVVFTNNNVQEIIFITEIPGEPTYNEDSWSCEDNYRATASLSNNQKPQSQTWWDNEARISCTSHGSKPRFPSNPIEPKYLDNPIPITGNAVYQPNTYTGWVLFNLGIFG